MTPKSNQQANFWIITHNYHANDTPRWKYPQEDKHPTREFKLDVAYLSWVPVA